MGSDNKFRIYIAAYLVLTKSDKVLLLQRANTGYQDGNYSLVAGHLDGGETAKHCIIREAKEEANITLLPQNVKVAHVMHRFATDREYIDIYLTASKWEGKIKNLESKKCDDLNWFKLGELPNNIIPEVKLALTNIKKKIPYGEFGW